MPITKTKHVQLLWKGSQKATPNERKYILKIACYMLDIGCIMMKQLSLGERTTVKETSVTLSRFID